MTLQIPQPLTLALTIIINQVLTFTQSFEIVRTSQNVLTVQRCPHYAGLKLKSVFRKIAIQHRSVCPVQHGHRKYHYQKIPESAATIAPCEAVTLELPDHQRGTKGTFVLRVKLKDIFVLLPL